MSKMYYYNVSFGSLRNLATTEDEGNDTEVFESTAILNEYSESSSKPAEIHDGVQTIHGLKLKVNNLEAEVDSLKAYYERETKDYQDKVDKLEKENRDLLNRIVDLQQKVNMC